MPRSASKQEAYTPKNMRQKAREEDVHRRYRNEHV
jgi:hypothetical protein